MASVQAIPRPRASVAFNGVKVFCATKYQDRERLGETVTQWLQMHPGLALVDLVVTQSSDAEFHCVTISVFYFEKTTRTSNAP